MLSFAFDANQETPESVARRRALAEALVGSFGRANNVGEGIGALLAGIAGGMSRRRADTIEREGRSKVSKLFSSLFAPQGTPSPASFSDPSGIVAPEAPPTRRYQIGPGAKSFAPGGNEGIRRALLDTIAGPESAGRFDVMYGGGRFKDFSDHPRVPVRITSGPNAGKTSSAAGKYQFLGPTWDEYRAKLGLKDFTPRSQDAAAWALASDVYRKKTGGDLERVLSYGSPEMLANVGKVLSGTWTSLPGGIEQGTNTNKFVQEFNRNRRARLMEPSSWKGQVASLDPAAGIASLAGGTGGVVPPQAAPPVQVAQAAPSVSPMPAAPAMPRVDTNALIQLMQNPWLPDAQREVLGAMLKQQMEQADPAYQVGLQKNQLELERMRNPVMTPADQAQIELAREKFDYERNQPITLGGNSRLVGPDGKVILGADPTTDGGAEYGLNPVVTQNPQTGEYMLLQPNKGGGAPAPIAMPPGYQYVPPMQNLDIGTGFQRVPQRGMTTNEVIPKDVRGAEIQQALGKKEGEQAAAAPADYDAGNMAIGLVDQLRNDPNRRWGTGATSLLNVIPGTPGKDFQLKVDQAVSGAFLTAIQQMRGLGSLSNAEGDTAKRAVTRMNTASTEQGFLDALNDYEKVIKEGQKRALARMGKAGTAPTPDGDSLEDALRKYAP
jgi:muramidase (phage lysozyme)